MVPAQVLPEAKAAERAIFTRIRDAESSEEYICFHSLGMTSHRRKEFAEIDFVVVGPAGVFCLEVKGGEVVRKDGKWIIGWPNKPNGTYISAEGPFKQAEGARWGLNDFLKDKIGPKIRTELVLGWGVVFPDIVFDEDSPEWDNDVVYDKRDAATSFVRYLERLESYFRRRKEVTGKSQPQRLGQHWIKEIAECLRGDFEAVYSIKGLLLDSRRELVSLSPEQYRVLDLALNDHNPRLLCDGAAGTGKTLIAMEAARRLSSTGKKVLLLCFNSALNRFLARDAEDLNATIQVSTVFGFLGDQIRAGGLREELTGAHRAAADRSELYRKRYAELFDVAADNLSLDDRLPQFDALIIDEAQDILDVSIMNCLDVVLIGGFARGRWLICMDGGFQSDLYGRINAEVLSRLTTLAGARLQLTENFRNPKNIVGEMCRLLGTSPPVCRRAVQSNVDYKVYNDERDQAKKLRALLVELLRDGVSPGDITILSGAAKEASSIIRFAPDVGKEIKFLDGGEISGSDAITASTISAFKGLENDVIILTDLPPVTPRTDWANSVLYVGMTRVRSKIFAFVSKEFLNDREQL
jgi:hypothetical protein